MIKHLITLLLVLTTSQLIAQEVEEMTTPIIAKEAFQKFIEKDKFGPDENLKYAGIKDKNIKVKLIKGVNAIAKDFMEVSREEVPTNIKYQIKIMHGLSSFNEIKKQLETEDRARMAHYIIELMDIINLKSSAGQLNMFVYGFDPSTLKLDEKKKK